MTLILGAIQNAPVGMGWRLLFAIVASVIAIMITKPVASFKSMAGLDPARSYLSALLRRAGGTALGVVAGNRFVDRYDDAGRGVPGNPAASPGDLTTTYRVQPVEPSMPPLPPPASTQVVPVDPTAALRSGRAVAEPRLALQAHSPDPDRRALPAPTPVIPTALPAEPEDWAGANRPPAPAASSVVPPDDGRRVLRPVRVVPVVEGAVIRRPVITEHAAYPAVDRRVRTEPPGTEPADRPTSHPRRRAPQVSETEFATHPAPIEIQHRTNRIDPEPARRPVETTVTYPTGIVVQSQPGLYRPDRPLRIEEYLRFPEPQVDANGEETWTPLYHAKAAR
jgi:hypothetical protein